MTETSFQDFQPAQRWPSDKSRLLRRRRTFGEGYQCRPENPEPFGYCGSAVQFQIDMRCCSSPFFSALRL